MEPCESQRVWQTNHRVFSRVLKSVADATPCNRAQRDVFLCPRDCLNQTTRRAYGTWRLPPSMSSQLSENRIDGWNECTLGDICQVDWGNTKLTKKSFVEDGEFLAVSAAGCDGRIGHAEHSKFTPVLSAIGSRCGRMFFPEEDFTAIKNTITLTPNSDYVNHKFLYYLLTSVKLPQRGAGQPFISKRDIQKFTVSIPSLEEQQRIVSILDETFTNTKLGREKAQLQIELFDSLENSSLREAFNGRL